MLKVFKWIYNRGQQHRLIMMATLVDDYINNHILTQKEISILADIKDKLKSQYRYLNDDKENNN